jgi:TPR repeat protein
MESENIFKSAIAVVCNDLGLLQKELANFLVISTGGLSKYSELPYKWIRIDNRRVILLILYFGENSVSSYDAFKKRLNQEVSINLQAEEDIREKFEKAREKAFKIVRGRLQDLDEDKVKATNADREKIRERISLKFPKQVEIYEEGKEMGEIEVKVDSTLPENQTVAEADSVLAENQTAAEADSVLPENQTTVEADNGLMEKQAVESVQNNKTDEASEAIPLDEYSQVQREAEKEYKAACVMTTHDEEYIQHMLRAAELGHRDAKYYLGVAYMDGDNVIRDPEKAVTYFFEAGKMGSINAVYKLKICYAEGIGVEKNERNATWLLRILRKNHYQPDSPTVDISLDPKVKLANNYKKEFKEFIPKTLNDRKLQELILTWKNKI